MKIKLIGKNLNPLLEMRLIFLMKDMFLIGQVNPMLSEQFKLKQLQP